MALSSLLGQLVEDYSCLALLGIIVGLISWIVDKGVHLLDSARMWLLWDVTDSPVGQYFLWITITMAAMLFSAGFVILVEPHAAGSGIPEMKTILRGVELKGYLTFRMLVAKVVGMTATLGSGMPLGKEGPFVHIGAIVAQLVNNVFQTFKVNYDKARNSDILAAGTAVGIAACFAAPVGGMLFSIEVTSTYFAVRHYWRRYLAALWGAIMFRLLAVFTTNDVTFTPLFATSFPESIPYNPYELFCFAMIGVICGLFGALFVWLHRKYIRMIKYNPLVKKFLGLNKMMYPGVGALIIGSITFPLGFGRFIGSQITTHHQMMDIFNNITWSSPNLTVAEADIVRHWVPEGTNVFANLFCYFCFHFLFSMIAYTFPVPCGAFVPSLKIGSAIGRLFGEVLFQMFPKGFWYDGIASAIVPGGYAVVGAAAFSAALTRSIAVAVIVLEVTGQLTHLLPILLAVLVAYSVVSLLQPSLYDSIIMQKDLPYLPDLRPSAIGMYSIYAESFTKKDVVFIWDGITYGELKDILRDNRSITLFPLVDSARNMILLGSVDREEMLRALEDQVGPRRRLEVAQRRKVEAEARRAKEEMEWMKCTRMNRRKSTSVGALPEPDLTTTTSQKVFAYKKSLRSLSRQNSSSGDRFRSTISNIFNRNSDSPSRDLEIGAQVLATSDPNLLRGLSSKRVKFIKNHIDFSPAERRTWELAQLKEKVNFLDIVVNPAPVQLVEKTPLSDVHSLFSMVGIRHAYVTNIGRLVGVVGLKELKAAIDDVNSGEIEKYFDEDLPQEGPLPETPLLERLDKILFSEEQETTNQDTSDEQEHGEETPLRTNVERMESE